MPATHNTLGHSELVGERWLFDLTCLMVDAHTRLAVSAGCWHSAISGSDYTLMYEPICSMLRRRHAEQAAFFARAVLKDTSGGFPGAARQHLYEPMGLHKQTLSNGADV